MRVVANMVAATALAALAACAGGDGGRDGGTVDVFAAAYADQNERDHAALAAAVRDGAVAAEPGR